MEDPKLIKIPRTSQYVAFTSCHKIPERSFSWKGKTLMCYRCLGLDLGFLLFVIILLISMFFAAISPIRLLEYAVPGQIRYYFLGSILLQLPFIIDGVIQAFTRYNSNNPLRFITGFLGGVGQFYLLISIGALIGFIIRWF